MNRLLEGAINWDECKEFNFHDNDNDNDNDYYFYIFIFSLALTDSMRHYISDGNLKHVALA